MQQMFIIFSIKYLYFYLQWCHSSPTILWGVISHNVRGANRRNMTKLSSALVYNYKISGLKNCHYRLQSAHSAVLSKLFFMAGEFKKLPIWSCCLHFSGFTLVTTVVVGCCVLSFLWMWHPRNVWRGFLIILPSQNAFLVITQQQFYISVSKDKSPAWVTFFC